MKTFTLLVTAFCSLTLTLSAQVPKLVKKWETTPTLKTPESVLYDAGASVLYVSNIDGMEPWAKDGKGSIAKVGLDGKVLMAEWVEGLEAPKGLGLYQDKLYVADLDQVVVINVVKGIITERITVEGAQRLNDISIDRTGVVYVTDSGTKKVFTITKGKAALYLENLKGPNGILAHGNDLYVLDAGALLKVEKNKSLTTIVDGLEGNTDGIEPVKANEFIVSCWRGVIYYVAGKEKTLLLDTRPQSVHSADIGYDAKNRVVYVPTFFTNTVVAYELR